MSRYSTDFGDDDLLDEPSDPVELMRDYLARNQSPPMFVCFQVLQFIDGMRAREDASSD